MNNFSNDGSFMEMFLKEQSKTGDSSSDASETTADSTSAPEASSSTTTTDTADSSGSSSPYGGYPQGYPPASGAAGYPAAGYPPGYPSPYPYYPAYPGYYAGYPPVPGGTAAGGDASSAPALMPTPTMLPPEYAHGGAAMGVGGMGLGATASMGQPPPSNMIWVGNIHPDTSEHEIRAVFQSFGNLEHVKIVAHKNCAFLTYGDLESARAAHSGGQGHWIHGQEIRVGWGKAEPNRRDQQREDTGPKSKNLWIGNLDPEITEEDIREKFSAYGYIEHVKLLPGKNCGFVNFESVQSAERAKRELFGQYLGSRPMKINYGRIEPDREPTQSARRDSTPFSPPQYSEEPELPPPAVPPPSDSARQDVIDKTAAFVAKNGPVFERMMKNKERNNPKLDFLFGGEDHAYYQYKLWSLRQQKSGGPSEQALQHTQTQPPSHPETTSYSQATVPSGPLSTEDKIHLQRLLSSLTGTKDSIKSGKDWIFQHWNNAADVINVMRSHVESAPTFEKKLVILHLISDALHHAAARRPELGLDSTSLDDLSEAFKMPLVFIMRSAYQGQQPDQQQRVLQLLELWESRNIYGSTTIARMKSAIESVTTPMEPPHTLSAQSAQSSYSYGPPASYHQSYASSSAAGGGYGGGYDYSEQQQQHYQRRSSSSYYGGDGGSAANDSPTDNDNRRSRSRESSRWDSTSERERKRRRSPSPKPSKDDRDYRSSSSRKERRGASGWDS